MKIRQISTLAILSMLAPTALSAQATQAPGVIDRDVPSIELPKSFSLDQKQVAPIKPAPEMEKADNEKVIANISNVEFTGVVNAPEADLQAIAAPYLNRDITEFDLGKLKFELSTYYYQKGLILIKVVTPPQDLKLGTLRIDVYEAKVGSVHVKNDGFLVQAISDAVAGRISSDDVFEESDVESMISDFNNLNGIGATLNLKKGEKFGRTDLDVLLFDADEDTQYVSVDNYGSPLTGEVVFSGHLEASNLAHFGEKIYTDVRRSNGDLWSVAVGGETPIGIKNIELHLNYLHSENEIGDRLAFQQASGESDILTAWLSSDIINVTKQRLTLAGGIEARRHESFSDLTGAKITTSEDDVRQVFAQLTYLQREDDMVLYGSARIVKGIDALGADDAGVGRSDPNADPEAWRFQPVFLANILSPISDGTFQVIAAGQFASDQVLSSDLFSLGGYGSVRGFDPAQETGESGYAFSLEYLHNMPDLGDFGVRFGPFFDGGAVYNRNISAVDSHLYSMGLGIELEADLVPSAGTTIIRLDWAQPLGSYQSTLVDDNHIFFRVTQEF